MQRSGYRDDPNDPDDPAPFTEQDWVLWTWADSWRQAVHRFENEMDRLPEAARSRAQQYAVVGQAPIHYEPLHSIESLAKAVR